MRIFFLTLASLLQIVFLVLLTLNMDFFSGFFLAGTSRSSTPRTLSWKTFSASVVSVLANCSKSLYSMFSKSSFIWSHGARRKLRFVYLFPTSYRNYGSMGSLSPLVLLVTSSVTNLWSLNNGQSSAWTELTRSP